MICYLFCAFFSVPFALSDGNKEIWIFQYCLCVYMEKLKKLVWNLYFPVTSLEIG